MKILDELAERKFLQKELPTYLPAVVCHMVVEYHCFFLSLKNLEETLNIQKTLSPDHEKLATLLTSTRTDEVHYLSSTTSKLETTGYFRQMLLSGGLCVFVDCSYNCRTVEALSLNGEQWIYSKFYNLMDVEKNIHFVGSNLLDVFFRGYPSRTSDINPGVVDVLQRAAESNNRFLDLSKSFSFRTQYYCAFNKHSEKIGRIEYGEKKMFAIPPKTSEDYDKEANSLAHEKLSSLMLNFESLINHPLSTLGALGTCEEKYTSVQLKLVDEEKYTTAQLKPVDEDKIYSCYLHIDHPVIRTYICRYNRDTRDIISVDYLPE